MPHLSQNTPTQTPRATSQAHANVRKTYVKPMISLWFSLVFWDAWPGTIYEPYPGSRAQTGGAVGLRFIVFLKFSFVFGMHMPLLGWKLILGWI